MRGARTVTGIVAVLALVLTLGACSKTLEMDRVESEIESGIESQTGASVLSVDCPDEVEAVDGDTFECTAVAEDGSQATVEVTQTSDDGDISWEVQ